MTLDPLKSWLPQELGDPRLVVVEFLETLCRLSGSQYAHLRLLSPSGHYFALVESLGPYKHIGWPRRCRPIDGNDLSSIAFAPMAIADLADCTRLSKKYVASPDSSQYLSRLKWGIWVPVEFNGTLAAYAVVTGNTDLPSHEVGATLATLLRERRSDIPAVLLAARCVAEANCQQRLSDALATLHLAQGEVASLKQFARLCVELWGDICTVYVGIPNHGHTAVDIVQIAGHREPNTRSVASERTKLPWGKGLFGAVIAQGKTLLFPDLREQASALYHSLTEDSPPPGSAVCAPIFSPNGGDLLAVISVESELPRFFDIPDIRYLDSIGMSVAHAVTALRSSRHQQTQDLDLTFQQMCHDVAEPLQAVVADAEVLQYQIQHLISDRTGLAPKHRRRILNDITLRSASILVTVDKLYGHVRGRLRVGLDGVNSPKRQGVLNLRRAVVALIDRWEERASLAAIDFAVDLDAFRGVYVSCDATEFEVAIGHVVGNAVKYSYHGSRDTRRRISVTGYVRLNRAILEVENYGIGILPGERSMVKERFYRGELARKEGRAGTGQGLSRADEFTTSLGGTLDIESEPVSEGAPEDGPWLTTVRVAFPVSEG